MTGTGAATTAPLRLLAAFRHPTPYRDGLLDRVAAMPGISLEVLYLGRTFAQTPWAAQPLQHAHRFPRGFLKWDPGGHEVAFHPGALLRLMSFRPDACVLSGWSDPTMVALAAACRALGIPYVLVIESNAATGRWTGAPRGLSWRIRKAMVRGASAWLPAGSRAREHAVALGAVRERCHFFPTSPDSRRLVGEIAALRAEAPPPRAALGLPEDGVVAFVGRVVHDKAPDVLMDAIGLLASRRACRLVVAGDGPLLPALKAHPAARHATFLGFVQPPDVLRLLAASDVLALPSRYETWGAVATEALAAGLPVVLSDRVGCAPDVLGGADPPGAIVPCEDAAALADALQAMLDRPDRRGALAEAARRRAVEWGHDLNAGSLLQALRDAGAT
jgi:glycosyltransferase involved in cell wall biosynthesis